MTRRLVLAGLLTLVAAGPGQGGDEVLILSHQGVARTAIVHRPPAATEPRPLVLALAGRGVPAAEFQKWSGFDAVADREGFVVVYPEAINREGSYGRATSQPMPVVDGQPVDDVGFIRLLIDELVARGLADPGRVSAAGSSRGGLLAYTLACALPDRLAAAAALITGMTDHQREACRPARPVPLMVVAGTADPVQSYDGWLLPSGRLLSVPETLEFWRTLHGCTGQTGKLLPHREPTDTTRVALIEWTGCRTPGALRLYRVEGGGHHAPSRAPGTESRFGRRNRDVETAEEVWTFVKGFSR